MTDKQERYEATEKGKEARARSRAKQQKKRSAAKEQRVAAVRAERQERFEAARLAGIASAEAQQRKREELERNPPVNQASVDAKEKRVWQLMDLFEPRRGMLTRSCRIAIEELIERISPIQDSLLRTVAKNYNMGKPMGAGGKWWVYSHNWPYDVEENENLLRPVFHREGRLAFVREFDRHFALHLISERRMVKQEREQQLVACLHVMLPE
jgi:hypothetical protein